MNVLMLACRAVRLRQLSPRTWFVVQKCGPESRALQISSCQMGYAVVLSDLGGAIFHVNEKDICGTAVIDNDSWIVWRYLTGWALLLCSALI